MSTLPDTKLATMLGVMLGSEGLEISEKMEQNKVTAPGRHKERKWHLARSMRPEVRKALESMGFEFPKETAEDLKDSVLIPVIAPEGWSLKTQGGYGYWSDIVDAKGGRRGSLFYKGAFWDRDALTNVNPRFRCNSEYAEHPTNIEDMPPEIRALQVLKKVQKQREPSNQYERPPNIRRHIDGSFVDYGPAFYREPPIEYEEKLINTFDPYKNKKHAKLPFKRYYVEDSATGERVWLGPWISKEQCTSEFSGVKEDPELNGLSWLEEHYPDWKNPLAYW